MFASQHGLPLVQDDHGTASNFDAAWLRCTLTSAAAKAGYPSWWLVDDLVAGISAYLRHDYASNVIALSKLEKVVRTVLCRVGYQEVAVRVQTVMPYSRISLVQCLRQLTRNDQTEFFERLGEQIALLDPTKPQHVHFSDLHACVRGLTGIHPTGCKVEDTILLPRVIAFVRERVETLQWQAEARFSIS